MEDSQKEGWIEANIALRCTFYWSGSTLLKLMDTGKVWDHTGSIDWAMEAGTFEVRDR